MFVLTGMVSHINGGKVVSVRCSLTLQLFPTSIRKMRSDSQLRPS